MTIMKNFDERNKDSKSCSIIVISCYLTNNSLLAFQSLSIVKPFGKFLYNFEEKYSSLITFYIDIKNNYDVNSKESFDS